MLQANKMIKYITEWDVDFDQTDNIKNKPNNQNTTKNTQQLQSIVDIPNVSYAYDNIRKLELTQDTIKRRLSVLRVQEQINMGRSFVNQLKYYSHQKIRRQIDIKRAQREKYLKELTQTLEDTREKVKTDRMQRQFNRHQSHLQLYISKVKDYSSTRQNSLDYMQTIASNKTTETQHKKAQITRIQSQQKQQKRTISDYLQRKRMNLVIKAEQQQLKLMKLRQSKLQSISMMEQIQMQMLTTQSNSRIQLMKSKVKINQMSNPNTNETNTYIKRDKSTGDVKLPILQHTHSNTIWSSGDLYIL